MANKIRKLRNRYVNNKTCGYEFLKFGYRSKLVPNFCTWYNK